MVFPILISEVSKRFGLTHDTLRYYERVGLIPPVPRSANGIRNYTDHVVGGLGLFMVCEMQASQLKYLRNT